VTHEIKECALCGDESQYVNASITVFTGAPDERKVFVCNESLACRRRAYEKMQAYAHLAHVAIGQVDK